MKEIAQADGLLIREMEAVPADFEQVLRWMTDPETMRFWEGMTEIYDLARVQAEYRKAWPSMSCCASWSGTAGRSATCSL